MRSFMKIKPSRNGKIALSFIDKGTFKSSLSREFFASIIRLLMLYAKIKFSRKVPNIQYFKKLMCKHKTGHNEGAKRFNAVSLVVPSHKLNTQHKSMRLL